MNATLQLVEKYRPKTLDALTLESSLKTILKSYIKKKSCPNLLLVGKPGIGKTSLSKIIGNELNAEVLYISAAVENNADTIRTKVKEFTQAISISGNIKLVILDEAENLSRDSGKGTSSQDVLKNLIEEAADDTRFILTANYQNKIIPAIQSRCTPFHIRYSKKDVAIRLKHILDSEKIEYNKDAFKDFCVDMVTKFFPDIRHIVNALEQSVINGKLEQINSISLEASSIENAAKELLQALDKKLKFIEIRKILISHVANISDNFESLLSEIIKIKLQEDYSEETKKFIIEASEYLHRMNGAIDKEIHMAAFLLKVL